MQLTLREKDFLAVLGFLTVFFVLVFHKIEILPGYQDEMEIADNALAIRYGAKLYWEYLFFWPTKSIPGMIVYYTGSLTTYIPVPFLYLFGPSLVSARLGFILFAAIGLIAIYSCIRIWLGRAAAFIATVLMTINTAFLHAVRTGGENEEAIVIYLFWIGAALILYALRRPGHRQYICIWLAGFLWGLGVFVKFLMLGYLLGLVCIWLTADKTTKDRVYRKIFISWHNAAAFILAFCLGSLPVINIFFIHKGDSNNNAADGFVALIINILTNREGYNITARVMERLNDLYFFFADTIFFGPPLQKQLFLIKTGIILVFQLLTVISVFLSKDSGKKYLKTLTRNIIILYSCIFLTLCMVPNTFSRAHMISLFPLIQLAQILTLAILLKIKTLTLKHCCVSFFAYLLMVNTAVDIHKNIKYLNPDLDLSMPDKAVSLQPFSYKAYSYIRNNNLYPILLAHTKDEYVNIITTAWFMAPAHKYNTELMRKKAQTDTRAGSKKCQDFYLFMHSTKKHPVKDWPEKDKPEIRHMATFRCPDNTFEHIYHVTTKNKRQNDYIPNTFPAMSPIYSIPPNNDLI